MSMWKMDAFSNDDALDFIGVLGVLSDSKKISIMKDALDTVSDTGSKLELSDACAAITCSALVAIQLSPTCMPEDRTIEEIMMKLPDITGLQSLAKSALDRCLDPKNNDWYESVIEQGGMTEMTTSLKPFLEILTT